MQKFMIFSMFFCGLLLNAQAQTENVADRLAEGNKINSVIVVLAVILAGIIAYLFAQDRRISKLEKELKD